MADVQHSDLPNDQLHEPIRIKQALTSDAGKVLTPSDSSANTSVLRKLDSEEISYDNSDSGLTASDVKAAIDEVIATRLEAYGSNTITNGDTAITVPDAADDTFQTAGDYVEVVNVWDSPQVEPFDRVTTTANDNRLVVPVTGVYEVNFWATSELSVNNSVVGYNFGINGTVSTDRTVAQRFPTSGERYGIAAHGLIDVDEDDEISMHAVSTAAGDLTIVNARVSLRLVERT